MKLNNILVPLDFSTCAEQAFDYALNLAESYQSGLTLVHVAAYLQVNLEPHMRAENYESLDKKQIEMTRNLMKEYVDNASERGIDATTSVIAGISEADAIVDFMHGKNIDLVVMGTHGRSGIRHLILGSIAEKMCRVSPIPVLTVHRGWTAAPAAIEKILVPVDFSEHSRKSVELAQLVAEHHAAQLHLLHVLEIPIYATAHGLEVVYRPELNQELRGQLAERMQDFCGYAGKDALHKVVLGSPHHEIVNYASDNQIDLIVMGTRGLSGLQHLLIGSVAERVIRHSNVPVLTTGRQHISDQLASSKSTSEPEVLS